MASFGPITSLRAVSDAITWAHCICCSSCRWLRNGPFHFLSSCCRWLRFGPLLLCELLPMPQHGPTASAASVADGFVTAHSIFFQAADDGFVWAHCFSGSCVRCHSMGPLHLLQSSCRWLRRGPFHFGSCCRHLMISPLLFL